MGTEWTVTECQLIYTCFPCVFVVFLTYLKNQWAFAQVGKSPGFSRETLTKGYLYDKIKGEVMYGTKETKNLGRTEPVGPFPL